jgi:hypothetical protein
MAGSQARWFWSRATWMVASGTPMPRIVRGGVVPPELRAANGGRVTCVPSPWRARCMTRSRSDEAPSRPRRGR